MVLALLSTGMSPQIQRDLRVATTTNSPEPPISSPRTAAPAHSPNFDLEEVGRGVYAVVRREPQGRAGHSNALFIVGDSDVIVVDAQFTRLATQEVIGALRTITRKPVTYVINTHWHDDHVFGDQVYADSFPGVQFIAQSNTREALTTIAVENRQNQWKYAPPIIAHDDSLLRERKGQDGQPLTASEEASQVSTLRIFNQYLREAPGFRLILPTVTFDQQLTLYRGNRRIEVRYLGRGHTRGDAIVYLPDDGIVATGDLVVAPIPLAFGAFIGDWIAALAQLRALNARVIVPGHGPVFHDDAYVTLLARMFNAVKEQVAQAVAKGATLDDVKREVTLDDFRAIIAGEDRWRRQLFNQFFLTPAITAAFQEATSRHGVNQSTTVFQIPGEPVVHRSP
jgi:glyoxylase-like metal-dependent hydrolase (beta-lactamase superfamily II)